jgi:outer membrane protein TolC
MKRKNMSLVFAALLLTVAIGIAAAGEILTLRQAVERTLLYSPQRLLAGLGREKAELEYEMTERTASQYRRLLHTAQPVQGEEAMLRFLYVNTVKAETDREIAEKQEERIRYQLAYEAQEKYLNLVRATGQKKLLEKTLERAVDLKRLADAAYSAGTVARSEVMRAEAHVLNMEAALFGAESAVKIAAAVLNMTMGRPIDAEVQPEESPVLPEPGEIDLMRGANQAITASIDLMKARAGLRLAQAARNYASHLHGGDEYDIADIGVREAEIFVSLTEDRIRLEIFGLYQKLAGAEKQLAARRKAMALAAENYRLSLLRYELGVATQGEVIDTMLALLDQETRLLSETYDYYLDYLTWRLKTGLPVN